MVREVEEINEIVRIIRNEDDEKVYYMESRLFNGVIDDNKVDEELQKKELLLRGKKL